MNMLWQGQGKNKGQARGTVGFGFLVTAKEMVRKATGLHSEWEPVEVPLLRHPQSAPNKAKKPFSFHPGGEGNWWELHGFYRWLP